MRRALAIAVTVAWCAAPSAQQAPLFRSGVDVVRIDVSVMNGAAAVPNLTAAHFRITDNGQAQAIDSVSVDSAPLDLMLVLDTSGSLQGAGIGHLGEAARSLVQSLKAADRAALVTFSDSVRLAVPMTGERGPIIQELSSLKADGGTALHDATFLGYQMREPSTDARPVMLLFSDGRDTVSWLTGAQAIEAARRSGMVTHAVELMPMRPVMSSGGLMASASPFLRALTDAGGGRRWSATSSRDLRQLFARVIDELRARYLITYTPQGVTRAGWHAVAVSLAGAKGEVIARPGYLVPE